MEEQISIESDGERPAGRIWREETEAILKRMGDHAVSYEYMHNFAYREYRKWNMWFVVPVIVLQALTGAANFAHGTFESEAIQAWFARAVGAACLSGSIITIIHQALKWGPAEEGHRLALELYGKLKDRIRVELALDLADRSASGKMFLRGVVRTLEALRTQSPPVPTSAVSALANHVRGGGIDIDLPDVVSLVPVVASKPTRHFDTGIAMDTGIAVPPPEPYPDLSAAGPWKKAACVVAETDDNLAICTQTDAPVCLKE